MGRLLFVGSVKEFHCRFIQNVPPTCSRQCLIDYFSSHVGIQRVYFGDAFHCPPYDLSRPAYILFDTPEHAAEAFKSISGYHIPIKDTLNLGFAGLKEEEKEGTPCFVHKCSIWRSFQKPVVLSARANTDERVKTDFEQCVTLWNELSRYWV